MLGGSMRDDTRHTRFTRIIEFLCSPACGGRRTATRESAAARGLIIDELSSLGLLAAGTHGFEQPVPISGGANVLARLPGRGPLADRAILVAAHYDHLGWAKAGVAFWGADDNAAAVAIMLDVARSLAARSEPLSRQIIFAAFDAEEPPHFLTPGMGSMFFVEEPTLPLQAIDTMICMDLVGHAIGREDFSPDIRESLFVLGAERSETLGKTVDSISASGVRPRRMGIDVVPSLSDYHAFQLKGVPSLFLTSGRWQHYHTVHDTPEKLDYAKILGTATYLTELVVSLANAPVKFGYDAHRRDDAITIATLRAFGAALGARLPQVQLLTRKLDQLSDTLRTRGSLPREDIEALAYLVGAMENVLG